MFISALRIWYPKPSLDPVFSTDTSFSFPGDPDPYYYKADPRARVVACIDTHELCTPDESHCWSMGTNMSAEGLPPDYWMMKLSMEKSRIFYSMITRLGNALIAQDKVSGYLSESLGDKHWMKEMERMFATSLARIQFDAWSIASGEDWARSEDGYDDQTPEEAGNLCGIFKFISADYTNISIWSLVAWIVVPFLVMVGSVERSCSCFPKHRKRTGRELRSVDTNRTVGRENGALPENPNDVGESGNGRTLTEDEVTSRPSNDDFPLPEIRPNSQDISEVESQGRSQNTDSSKESEPGLLLIHWIIWLVFYLMCIVCIGLWEIVCFAFESVARTKLADWLRKAGKDLWGRVRDSSSR